MRIIFAAFLFIVMTFSVHPSTITAHMEIVLSNSGELIDGPVDLTVSIVDPNKNIRWKEDHKNVIFSNGVTSFEIGRISEIKTYHFYDKGTQLTLTINNDTISLPMYSTPFSLFSHAADVVNAIHMEGVFHTDLENKRIGINIDVPTPSVRLEVNGAMRLGDDPDIDQIGTIRWRNNRLEGRHNHAWKYLDVSPADGFESKWENNNSNSNPAFYVLGSSVLIATTNIQATLTANGALDVHQLFKSGGTLTASGRLNLIDDYGVSENARVFARSVTLNATNYYNFTDGLAVSGILTGKGHGVSNIKAVNLRLNAIQNNELADFSVNKSHIVDDAITNSKVQLASITRDKFQPGFKLSNDYFLSQIVTNNKVKRGSVHEDDLSLAFQLMAFHFQDASVVSRNIGAGEIDAVKINDDELVLGDFGPEFIDQHNLMAPKLILNQHIKDNDILAEDFLAGALRYSHFSSLIPINKGGTDQSAFGGIGELLVVSANQFISDSNFVLNSTGLGVNTSSPLVRLDVHQSDGLTPLRIRSTQDSSTGMVLKNDIGHWFIGLTSTANLEINDRLNNRRLMSMNKSNGHIGVFSEPSTELMTVNGGVLLGDKSVANGLSLKEGTMFFSAAENKFKLRTSLGVSLLDLGPINPEQQVPSTLYVRHITNQSTQSRVLLGENTQLQGSGHLIRGSFNSLVDGNNQHAHFMHASVLSGAGSTAQFINHSQLMGRNLTGKYLDQVSVFGDGHQVEFSKMSIVNGENNQLAFNENSAIIGQNHQLKWLNNARVSGNHHFAKMLSNSQLVGSSHSVDFSNHVSVAGFGHVVKHANQSALHGQQSYVMRASKSTLIGDHNVLDGVRNAVVAGDWNHLIQSSGTFIGDANRHYGSGSPMVMGNHNVLMGHFSGHAESNAMVSIGSSDQHIGTDHSIHFHAPGGVDIVSGDMALAHLAPNAGSWAHVSDRKIKTNIRSLDSNQILSKVIELPIMEWSYKGQHYVQHIGPMAQDFYSLFGLGSTNRYIQSVDMDGVIFSSIQELGSIMNQLKADYSKLDQVGLKMGEGLSVASTDLNSLKVSGNQLVNLNQKLNQRFESLYKKESQQVKVIERLNQDISAIRALREGIE